ncbi:HesA/MoeB/ThiF family protein [Companilactobacillus versmoldensis]|uniref:Molybdopterin biosynthesis protein MoeB n=1 Tax=Companilactobacillus versmoldensis DSM 14857 = KCTC 3814 TaxID=1423815 RepID=A0A0R1SFV5_9LACO|nr:HesA/MoeB/ThiF family protein [Companilactobacillus versmoldensis]KRL67502.1 molybdopterin biosynthesis protein MoeB [Companilactobacillus versmoldensis DSM 14857 = KCTC 3814]
MVTSRYDRQLKIEQIGEKGQKKFGNSHVLVIGVGGLGSFVSSELVKAGIGEITLVDFDKVEFTNLHRQNLYTEKDVNNDLDKLNAMNRHLQAANSEVKINLKDQKYSADLITDDYDLVIDCTDNFPVKYQINQDCYQKNVPHIFATCAGNQGQAMFMKSQDDACLECLYPHQNIAKLGLSANIGTNPMIVAITGSLEASMALKFLVDPDAVKSGNLIVVDNWNFDFRKIHVKKQHSCPICGGGK